MYEHSTARIPLKTNDRSIRAWALVDAEDYEWLSQWTWSVQGGGYVGRSVRVDGKYRIVLMHRLILGTPLGMDTDHINGDSRDNRRTNLRVATRSQNLANQPKQCHNTSGYKGVCWDKQTSRWRAFISVKGKTVSLGRFDDIEDAAQAYREAAVKHFGSFAHGALL